MEEPKRVSVFLPWLGINNEGEEGRTEAIFNSKPIQVMDSRTKPIRGNASCTLLGALSHLPGVHLGGR